MTYRAATETIDTPTPENLTQLEQHIQCCLGGRVRDFRLFFRDQGLVLRGHTHTYYVKQLAQQAVMNLARLAITPMKSRCFEFFWEGKQGKRRKRMISHKLLRTEGILILTPEAPLESTDFERLAQEIDPYIEENGKLHGLMIDAESFPGWKDFAALIAHLRFVKNHHQKVTKVAVVSDSSFLSFAPKIAGHFVQADIRHFPRSQKEDALRWLTEDNH